MPSRRCMRPAWSSRTTPPASAPRAPRCASTSGGSSPRGPTSGSRHAASTCARRWSSRSGRRRRPTRRSSGGASSWPRRAAAASSGRGWTSSPSTMTGGSPGRTSTPTPWRSSARSACSPLEPRPPRPAATAQHRWVRLRQSSAVNVAEMLDGKRGCICAGSGGVGKTTTSAAIALGTAARGLKVAVVTTDPAKRLANSLGLEELGNDPRKVEKLALDGELWAMMLDAKRTFDDVITRLAPDAKTRDQILDNRIYQQLSGAVAGTQEFTAVAKLYELDLEGDFDLLVLDTPPSRNALDFLDAPDRLTDFLEGRALQVFLRPAGLGARIFGKGTGIIFSILGRITGTDLLSDVSVFFQSLGGLMGGFRERATRVKALLGDPATTFLLVSSPERGPIEEAIFFHEKIAARRLPFGGVVVNRVHHDVMGDEEPEGVEQQLEGVGVEAGLAGAASSNLADYHALAQRDAAGMARLRESLGPGLCLVPVPHFDDDVHDVEGLERMVTWLFATDAGREEMLAATTAQTEAAASVRSRSATPRRSESRCPQSTSERSARVCAASSSTRRSGWGSGGVSPATTARSSETACATRSASAVRSAGTAQ